MNTSIGEQNLNLAFLTPFEQKVYGATRRIPVGKVSTYALIASVIGHRFSQRAVGNALNKSPHLVLGYVRRAQGKRCLSPHLPRIPRGLATGMNGRRTNPSRGVQYPAVRWGDLFCSKYFKGERCTLRCGDKNPFRNVPCHRVVRSDGFVGGYARGEKVKIKLLRKEGVKIQGTRVDPVRDFLHIEVRA